MIGDLRSSNVDYFSSLFSLFFFLVVLSRGMDRAGSDGEWKKVCN